MDVTAELRWFLPGPIPGDVRAWFDGLEGTPRGSSSRTDTYLRPTDAALGVKLRQGRLELKRRDGAARPVTLHPLVEGEVEVWVKWGFAVDGDAPDRVDAEWIDVAKNRWMRAYAVDGTDVAPVRSAAARAVCNVELTAVRTNGAPWWTVCFEAHTDDASVAGPPEAVLRRVAAHVLAESTPPKLPGEAAASYPDWLLDHAP